MRETFWKVRSLIFHFLIKPDSDLSFFSETVRSFRTFDFSVIKYNFFLMPYEKQTDKLIKNVQPFLNPGKYVFISVEESKEIPAGDIICLFREQEGVTYVIEKQKAEALKLDYSFIAAWISLNVYSSLEAVGLTAKVSQALAEENISCNAIAAFHHDHIFVPYNHADKAMALLRKL